MSGFIALHREAKEHHLFVGDSARFGAWFWIVATACWKPTRFSIGGNTITIDRGQLCASRAQLSKAWGWSPSAVERFLTRLETEQMIERATGQGRSVITVCNYDKYQDFSDVPGQATGQATGQRSDSHRTTKEQGNKGTIEEEEANASPSGAGAGELDLGDGDQKDAPPAKPKRTPKAKRQVGVDHPMPDGWEPALTARAQNIVDGWPPGMRDRELSKFRNHAADKGRLSKDWQAAFRTWIDNAEERRIANGNRNETDWRPAPRNSGTARVDGTTAAINDALANAQSRNASGAAGRSDAGDGQGVGNLPAARSPALR